MTYNVSSGTLSLYTTTRVNGHQCFVFAVLFVYRTEMVFQMDKTVVCT